MSDDRDGERNGEDGTAEEAEAGPNGDAVDPDRNSPEAFGLDADFGSDRTGNDDGSTEEPATGPPDESGTNADAPLGSLAASVDERRDHDVDGPDEGLFDQESVPEIDTDVVWERLDGDEQPALPDDADRDVRVIEKRSYCEQCPFFSSPPEVECTHDGTDILELVDMERFRVVDCPKVHENERLERL